MKTKQVRVTAETAAWLEQMKREHDLASIAAVAERLIEYHGAEFQARMNLPRLAQ